MSDAELDVSPPVETFLLVPIGPEPLSAGELLGPAEPSLPRRMPSSLDILSAGLKTGSDTIRAASAALLVVEGLLRQRKLRLAFPPANEGDDPIGLLQARLRAAAVSACVDGVNLLVLEDDETTPMVLSVGSAVARSSSGEIMIRTIEIDRAVTTLIEEGRLGPHRRGILDHVDAACGVSLMSPDPIPRGSEQALIDAATLAVGAAASHLSFAQSRLALQASFISSLSDAAPGHLSGRVFLALDPNALMRTAVETRRMLVEQPVGIANTNRETVMKLFRGS